MQVADRKTCPFCRGEIADQSRACECGRAPYSMKVAHPQSASREVYELVPDGYNYGISVDGKIKIHGLGFERARRLVELLNSVNEIEQAG